MSMLVALATLAGLLLGAWQGRKLGRVEGRDEEHRRTCAFLLSLAHKPFPDPIPPQELLDRVGALEHRNWKLVGK